MKVTIDKQKLTNQIKESQQGIDYVNSLEVKDPEIYKRQTPERNTSIMDLSLYAKSISNNIPKTVKRFKIINAFEKFLFAVFAMGVIFYACLFLYWLNH